jgi:hypothetical protein
MHGLYIFTVTPIIGAKWRNVLKFYGNVNWL